MIGVFDSGIGGLSILQALRAELPHEHFIYVADSGHAPYGEREDAHVIERSQRVTDWLAARDIKALVVACNTATAAVIGLLRAAHPLLPIVGVEPALKPAVLLSRTRRIGVMATRGTLGSRRFQALQASLAGQAAFVLQPCDGLASAIERSAMDGSAASVAALCESHLAAMGPFGRGEGEIDTLVLGCTHYPFAATHLRGLLGPDVELLANGEAVARQVRRRIAELEPGGQPGRTALYSTGDPRHLQAAAASWLGLNTTVDSLHF